MNETQSVAGGVRVRTKFYNTPLVKETVEDYIQADDACKKQCTMLLINYIKVKEDFNIVQKSFLEAINSLKSSQMYSTMITSDSQTNVDENLNVLNNIVIK